MKLWFEQTMTISFAIFVGIIIEGLVYCVFFGEDLAMFSLSWMQLLSVILTGTLCSVLTVIFLIGPDIPKNKYIVRIVLHCLGLYLIVSLFGWFFKWFTDLTGFIMVTILFFLVYVFVWAVSLWLHKRDDYKINKALDDIRDEE
ncbi:MAG: DUF3021 family protein [Clostridiales bacterium]|nr:DUF3021 family protein [Clostridiales bacterium]